MLKIKHFSDSFYSTYSLNLRGIYHRLAMAGQYIDIHVQPCGYDFQGHRCRINPSLCLKGAYSFTFTQRNGDCFSAVPRRVGVVIKWNNPYEILN